MFAECVSVRPNLNLTDESLVRCECVKCLRYIDKSLHVSMMIICRITSISLTLSYTFGGEIHWPSITFYSRWCEMVYNYKNKHPGRLYYTHTHTQPSIWPSRVAGGSAAAGLVECHPIPSLFQPTLDSQHIPLWSCHQWVKYYHNTNSNTTPTQGERLCKFTPFTHTLLTWTPYYTALGWTGFLSMASL